ncbi:TPA: hypothetical protein ACRNM8_004021, partial [Pseudomonas aeruginosa]
SARLRPAFLLGFSTKTGRFWDRSPPPQTNESDPGGPTVDNENETLVALLVIALIVFGIFRIVGDFQNLYEQTEQKGQELSRWSKQ